MTTKLMTNIDSYFYMFLDSESKKEKVTKRELIERIIAEYIQNQKEQQLKKSYEIMWKDIEYLEEMQENTAYLGNI